MPVGVPVGVPVDQPASPAPSTAHAPTEKPSEEPTFKLVAPSPGQRCAPGTTLQVEWQFSGSQPAPEHQVKITISDDGRGLVSELFPASANRASVTIPRDAARRGYTLEAQPAFGSYAADSRTVVIA